VTALVRLYPRAWRDRYEDEFLGVLAEAPPSFLDRVDILLGAMDARLHPEVPGDTRPTEHDARRAPSWRIGAVAAIAGGLLWALAGVILAVAPADPASGNKESTLGMVLVLLGSLCTAGAVVAAADVMPRNGRGVRAIGLGIAIGSLAMLGGWPLLVIGIFSIWILTALFAALLALQGARLIGLALFVSTALVVGMNTEDPRALLTIPFGLAWILLGAGLATGLRFTSTVSTGDA
jgi:hypothetical protein